MKLQVGVNEAILSNVGTTGEFRIRNSAKAFKILSDGLYSNKIRAIIRELSCNAVDSHVAAGKQDVPFEVHLPTMLEPWFSVRDFGLGLNNEQVVNIYTTYFESTKTESNEFIGALGLGSKSPFSYTENFTVTAIKDGFKRIYSAFINENGVPSIAEMSEELTDEGNGVEVKFSVTDKYDYQSFVNEAQYVFKWFKKKPNVTGNTHYAHQEVNYLERDIAPGVSSFSDNGGRHYGYYSFAVMGNIAYPLDKIPDANKHFGNLADLLRCGLILEFDIGELDFAASREELSYVPLTLNSIKRKLQALNDNLAIHLAKEADKIENLWLRADFLSQKAHEPLWNAAVPQYVKNTNFELWDTKTYYGKKKFTYGVKELEDAGITIQTFVARHGSYSRVRNSNRPVVINGKHAYEDTVDIEVDKHAIMVLNDTNAGCMARARFHFVNEKKSYDDMAVVYCISSKEEDPVKRQAIYNKLMADIKGPPEIVKASTLRKIERHKPTGVSNQGIMVLQRRDDSRLGYEDSYSWYPITEALDPKKTYYFVCLSNYQEINQTGSPINDFKATKALIDRSGLASLTSVEVYGVRKNRYEEIKAMKNWHWFYDKVREEVAKVGDAEIRKMVVSAELDNYQSNIYTNKDVAKLLPKDSPFAIFSNKYSTLKVSGDALSLSQLCSKYGNTIEVDKVKDKLREESAAIHKRYPLLKFLKSSQIPADEIANYMKMIDKNGETNE